MRWHNIGLLTVALLALGNAVTFGQEKAKAAVEQDKPKVEPPVRKYDEKEMLKLELEDWERLKKEIEKQVDQTQKELSTLRAELVEQTGLRGLRDSKVLNEMVGSLQIDVQRLRMEEVGLIARKEALEMVIGRAAREGRDLASADPIVRELTKLVSLREEAVEALRKDAHEARTVAMAQLVETRIKLEERLALLRSGTVGNAKLAERLMDTTISLAESQARLKQSETVLAKLRNRNVDRLLDLEEKAKDALSRSQRMQFELENNISRVIREARELERKPSK